MRNRLVPRAWRVKVAGAALAAAAAAADGAQDLRNAASWYAKSIERYGAVEITDEQWAAVREYISTPGARPGEQVRQVLARVQPVLSALHQGAQQDYSDFALDLSRGFELQLPHLEPLRDVGRLAAARAMLRLHDGDSAGAVAQIDALARMAGHVARDGTLVSSLVGQSVFRNADRVVRSGLDAAAFGPVEAGKLRHTLSALDGMDPFGVIDALEIERTVMVGWVRDTYAEAADRAGMIDELNFDDGPPRAAEAVAGLLLLDETRFESALEETEQVIDRVRAAFAMDDPDEARLVLTQIIEQVRRGEHGALAQMLVPDYERLYEGTVAVRELIRNRLGELRAIELGHVAPEELANAAVWYLRAVETVRKLAPEIREELRRLASAPLVPMSEEAAAAIDDLRRAIAEALREGSGMPRCDFSIAGAARRPAIPAYLGALREATALLLADAVGLAEQDSVAEAAARLATAFRLAAHLAGDGPIASCLVSHAIFNATSEVMRWALELFGPDERAVLIEALAAMPRRDPFGYTEGFAGARAAIVDTLGLDGEAKRRVEESVRRLDGDELLFLVVALGESGAEGAGQDAAALGDVISYQDVYRTADRAEQVRGLIAETGDLTLLAEESIPAIGRVRERFEAARADFRRTVVELARANAGARRPG